MKNIHFKPSQFWFMILVISTMLSCKETETAPADSLAGTYQSINNPLLCAMPSMSDVKIEAAGSSYNLTCRLFNTSDERLKGITTTKADSTTQLFYNGKQIGSFSFMKYLEMENGKFKERQTMVLMVRFDENNKYFEYMGKK
jgi:hypothetical protein